MIIPVVFSTDDNYIIPLSVAIQSLKNHKKKSVQLKVYVFYDKLLKENMDLLMQLSCKECEIQFVNVTEYFKDKDIYPTGYFSVAMYYRMAIPHILSEYDKVVYLDCDVLVRCCLSEIYSVDLGNNVIAGVHDVFFEDEKYINSGVLVFNLKQYIKNEIFKKCVDYIKENKDLGYPDQDAINFACRDKICYLKSNYNYFSTSVLYTNDLIKKQGIYKLKDVKIIHFVSEKKPWKYFNFPFSNLWWKESKKLPKDLLVKLKEVYYSAIDKRKINQSHLKYEFGSKIYKLYCRNCWALRKIARKIFKRK